MSSCPRFAHRLCRVVCLDRAREGIDLRTDEDAVIVPQVVRLSGRVRRCQAVSGRGWLLGGELDEVAEGVIEDRDDCGADVGGRLGE